MFSEPVIVSIFLFSDKLKKNKISYEKIKIKEMLHCHKYVILMK